MLIGGLSASDTSTTEVDTGDRSQVTQAATLGVAQHDAQAALLEGRVYVFGGGSFSELDHIFSFSPATEALATVGSLPAAQSDVAVTAIGNTAYVIGGYDGVSWKNTILAYSPGASTTRTVATIPVGLRYAAATAIDGRVLIAGGSTPTAASRAIFSFDPADRSGYEDRDPPTPSYSRRTGPAGPVRLPGGWSGERYELSDGAHPRDRSHHRESHARRAVAGGPVRRGAGARGALAAADRRAPVQWRCLSAGG